MARNKKDEANTLENYERIMSHSGRLKKAVGYVRVSTDAQAGDDKFGRAAQIKAILDYAEEHGYEIVTWKEDCMSGASDNRPALNEILYGGCYNPPYDAVIAFKSDRIARDTKLYFYYLYTLEKKNIKLLSTQEDFDEGSEYANIYRSLMMFCAEQERKNIAMRTMRGRKEKARTGSYAGGGVPFGYNLVDKQYVIDEHDAEIVRSIFEKYDVEHLSYNAIAIDLNEAGVQTRSGSVFRANSVKNIIENRMTYRGYYKYGGMEYVKGQHEPIIPDKDPEPRKRTRRVKK